MKESLDVLFEDNHLLVINKPAVLATMGAAEGEPSLLAEAKQYIKEKYSKPGNVYLGVVSRLDAFVTGVIVFARTSKAAARLTSQFQSGSVEKRYLAIVSGNPPQTRGQLEDWLIKNDRRRRMETTTETASGAKRARLNYERVAEFPVPSPTQYLIRIELLTGRKHQIRVQLSDRGMPIVGDRKYDSDLTFPNGIALHAEYLSFDHPTTKSRITIQCDPPKYWNIRRFSQ